MKYLDSICIRNLEVDCVVGVRPNERNSVQPLAIDLEMILDTEDAAATERLRSTVDYSAIANQLRFLLQSCRFRLLETAAHVLCGYLLMPPAKGEGRSQIDEVIIRLSKPSALQGKAIPGLVIHRKSDWVTIVGEETPFGTIDNVYQTRNARIYRLSLAPQAQVTLRHSKEMSESEMALTDGLLYQNQKIRKGTVQKGLQQPERTYRNPSRRFQSILCIEAFAQG